MKQIFEGWLFNRNEIMGNETFNHVGCEGGSEEFVDFIAQFVPELGMRRKVRFTVESDEEPVSIEEYKTEKIYI